MENISLYQYHFRPGYGSEHLLIEIYRGAENPRFETDLLEALRDIHPVPDGKADLMFVGEIECTVASDCGSFILHRDIWDLAFIQSDSQECLSRIDELLRKNDLFEKVEVDFDRYKLKEGSDS